MARDAAPLQACTRSDLEVSLALRLRALPSDKAHRIHRNWYLDAVPQATKTVEPKRHGTSLTSHIRSGGGRRTAHFRPFHLRTLIPHQPRFPEPNPSRIAPRANVSRRIAIRRS